MKKGENMINQKKDLNMITRKIETELPTYHYDGLIISEITTETSWMKLHVIVLFIKNGVQVTKELYKDYETGFWYYKKDDGMIVSHKDTFDHTIKNLVGEMIFDVNLEIDAQTTDEEYNSMCYDCKNFLKSCKGEKNKIYTGCVYKEKMEVR